MACGRFVVLGSEGERREYRSGVPARRLPTDEDRVAAMRGLLGGLVNGDDVFQISAAVADLHPRDNTFPGEVFIDLAADALALAGVNRQFPIDHEGLVDRFLSECEFRGRADHKIRYAVLVVPVVHGAVKPDLLDEVGWWQTDDFWHYALQAAALWIRAGAARLDVSVAELCQRIAASHDLALPSIH